MADATRLPPAMGNVDAALAPRMLARALVADHIGQYGAYELTCQGGILVCRR